MDIFIISSIKDIFSKCDQIRIEMRICSNLLKKFSMGNFIIFAVRKIQVVVLEGGRFM